MERLKLKKGHIFIYMGLLAASLLVMIFTRGIASTHARQGVAARSDTLKIGMQISPIGVSTHGDTLGGFYYDMVRQMAATERLPVKIEAFTQVAKALDDLDNGVYDIVIADIPSTTELKERFNFTNPIYNDRQVLVQLVDKATGQPRLTSYSQLRGDTVFLPADSPFKSRVRNLSKEIGDTIYVVEDEKYGPEQMVIRTAIGEIDNVIVNELVAKSLAGDYPDLDYSITISLNQFQSWAVTNRDGALLDSLNAYIERFKTTEAFKRLVDQYFNTVHTDTIVGKSQEAHP